MKEFDFIRSYLSGMTYDDGVFLGIGDDAAIVRPTNGCDICVSSDMLLAGRHFFANIEPEDLAHKVLAVNLSDMAAMGAKPRWVSLSAALPELERNWLDKFFGKWFALCRQYGISLIGGDTTRGHMAFSVNIMGELPQGKALRRSGAQIGDDVWVSGNVGSAASALTHLLGETVLPSELFALCEPALLRPQPRVALGRLLLPIANAALDISDGLVQDLEHITRASACGADIWADCLPVLPALRQQMPSEKWWETALTGGDDYELLFTASYGRRAEVEAAGAASATPVTRIGRIRSESGVQVWDNCGVPFMLNKRGFDHFG